MKKFTKILTIVLILAAIVYGLYFFLARDVVNENTIGWTSTAPYQLVAGTASSTAGVITLSTTTDSVSRTVYLGRSVEQATLFLQAKASSTATTLRLFPEISRDCVDFYRWGGVPTSTVLLISTSTPYTITLPSNANTATTSLSYTFDNLNAECMKFTIMRGNDNDTTKNNATLYAEVLLDN